MWAEVDGGVYRIETLSPVINGIVLPTTSIAFGPLLSATVSILRQRQLDIRTSLNLEACELR